MNKTVLKKTNTTAIVAASVLSLGLSLTQETGAAMTVTYTESGADVILNITGSLDLTGLSEGSHNINVGNSHSINNNQQLVVGSGSSEQTDKWSLTLKETNQTNNASTLSATLDSWVSNSNSIRFQGNNGQIGVDDAFGAQGTDPLGFIVNVTSQHTFAGKSLSDFGLTAGTDVLWMQNGNASGTDGDVRLVATLVPEPSSTALLGLGGLALMIRRRR